jgi:hypothetical protein
MSMHCTVADVNGRPTCHGPAVRGGRARSISPWTEIAIQLVATLLAVAAAVVAVAFGTQH